jgi:hypothetical protein
MLLVFSTSANKSKQIKREVEVATDSGLTVVPLRIENILPTESFKYFLGNIHWMDALTPPLEDHLKSIAEKVKAILSTDAQTRSEAAGTSPAAKTERIGPSSAERGTNVVLRRPALIAGAVLALVLAASVAIFWSTHSKTQLVNLAGTWSGNDAATYVIKQKDRKVSWTGGNPPFFENVFDGQITDQEFIEGDWHDLPGYGVYSGGKLRLKIASPDRLIVVSQTGGFSGTIWTRR